MDFSRFYDSSDSAAARAGAPAAPSRATPAPAPSSPATTQAERLQRFYDAPDTTVGGSRPAPPDPVAAAHRERLSRFYDDPSSREAGTPPSDAPSRTSSAPAPAAAKPAAAPPAADAPPAELELDPNDSTVQEFRQAAAEMRLDQRAQDRFLRLHQAALQAQHDAFTAEVSRWSDEVHADPELVAHADAARELVRQHGGSELSAFLDETGLGSHPALVRAFVSIAKSMRRHS